MLILHLDPTTATVSPVTSTFLNSASTTAQTSPSQGAISNSNPDEQIPAEPTSEHLRRTLGVLTRADSVVLVESPAISPLTQPSEADPLGQEKSSRRGSRGSVKISSRRGSGASNRVANKDRTTLPATSSPEKNGEEVTGNATKPKRKGLSRFFSVLNCCGAKKDASDLELDPAVPSKKAKTLQANRGRQATPMTRPNNASAGESSKTESKEAIEDNIAGKRYSELTPSTQPKIIEPPVKETPMTEKPSLQNKVVPSTEGTIVPVPVPTNDQPLPPLPAAVDNSRDTAMTNTQDYDEKSPTTGTDGLVEAPIPPPSDSMAEQGVSKEEATINDRPPQQEARDVEMSDAPPVAPTPEQPAPSADTSIQSPPQANLPPPPPLTNPRRPSASNRRASNGVAGEQPKGLLPPIADRFRGKKCLVLDLDETLVHSSFKVM